MKDRRQHAFLSAEPALGVLGKELRVRLLNCSPSGCLVESNSRLEIGTIASLRVVLQGSEFTDEVQVVRCQHIEGAGQLFHVGAQFLWTGAPQQQSLRQLVRGAALSTSTGVHPSR